MTPFDFSIYASGICGLLMVGGSIWLLKAGVIRLSEAAGGAEGLSVEVADKIKISTTYPALGLFLIGLLFIGTAIWFSRKPAPINIVGQLEGIDDPSRVQVTVTPDPFYGLNEFTPESGGKIDRMINVDLEKLRVTVNAQGYEPQTQDGTLNVADARNHKLALPANIKLKFTKTDQIAPIPAGANTSSPHN